MNCSAACGSTGDAAGDVADVDVEDEEDEMKCCRMVLWIGDGFARRDGCRAGSSRRRRR